jgi:hypothetical protein
MKILMRGAVIVAALAFAAAAHAGPGGSGYPRQGASVSSRVHEGPGSSTPYTVLHRSARWHRARLSASDRMADQLNHAELDRLRAGQPRQDLHCYNPNNPDCD